jgi:hypothetical protein
MEGGGLWDGAGGDATFGCISLRMKDLQRQIISHVVFFVTFWMFWMLMW